MKKIPILFVLLFIAFSTHAQLVYEGNSLSLNGPKMPPYLLGSGTDWKHYATTWHGKAHAWIHNINNPYLQNPLDASNFEITFSSSSTTNPGMVMIGSNRGTIYFFGWNHTSGELINNLYAGNFYSFSDKTAKANIVPVSGALQTILSLKPVTYRWVDNAMNNRTVHATANAKEIGFIAQDLEKVIPDVVAIGEDGNRFVNYQAIIPMLTSAIQELTARVEALENQLKAK